MLIVHWEYCCAFDNQWIKTANFIYRALSTEVEVELALFFQSTKIVLVVFGCAIPANLIKVD